MTQGDATGHIEVGHYILEVGNPLGSTLRPSSNGGDSKALSRAIERSKKLGLRKELGGEKLSEVIEDGIDGLSELTSKIERATDLFEEIASGRLDIKSVSDEVDALLGFLQRLARTEHRKEALKFARSLCALLALIGRWIELLRSLRIALRAAEEIGDPFGEAWALHELGTVHLLAGKHAEADDLLGRAREIREQAGDRRGSAVTERNLQVLCRRLRQLLHRGPFQSMLDSFRRRPSLATMAAAMLVVVGGVFGAMIEHSHRSKGTIVVARFHSARVSFSFFPSGAHTGQSIVFKANAHDGDDPVASYTWHWGDGDLADSWIQRHVYKEVGKYRVLLTVRDANGRVTGRAARLVVIQRPVDGTGGLEERKREERLAKEREAVEKAAKERQETEKAAKEKEEAEKRALESELGTSTKARQAAEQRERAKREEEEREEGGGPGP